MLGLNLVRLLSLISDLIGFYSLCGAFDKMMQPLKCVIFLNDPRKLIIGRIWCVAKVTSRHIAGQPLLIFSFISQSQQSI
jgi:hypothetical protein